jgi:hypothetical protein
MACLPHRREVARQRYRQTGSRRRSRLRGRSGDPVFFAPGWPRPTLPPEPDDRAEIGGGSDPEVRVAFAPGWPLPSSLTRR